MKILADIHVHTVASGHAYSTVIEIAKEASEKGLELVAITDHGPSMPGGPHPYYFGNLRVIPENIYGVRILKGVEANIIDYNGNLDLPTYLLSKLEIVVASFHYICYPGGDVETNTKTLINAMKNPYVDIIAHPGNPEFPIDVEKVLMAAREYDKLIEINNSSFIGSRCGSEKNCRLIARKAMELGVKLVLGSDAHIAFDVGRFDVALSIVEEAGIPEEQIMNTSKKKLLEYLKNRRESCKYMEIK